MNPSSFAANCARVVAVLCLSLSSALASDLEASGNAVVLSLDADGTPIVEYVVGDGAGDIRFADDDARSQDEVRARFWDQQDSCSQLTSSGIHRASSVCIPRFRLGWDDQPRDRLYPAVLTLRNGGRLIFTGYLAASVGDAPLAWKVRAPEHSVAGFREVYQSGELLISPDLFGDDTRGWIYIGPDRFVSSTNAILLTDDGVPPALTEVVSADAARLIELFAKALTAPLATKPTLYLEWSGRELAGRDLQADVVPGQVIRFGLNGGGWNSPSPSDADQLRAVLAHEIAHFWNHGVYQPNEDDGPWLHEGNAELMSTAALLKLGLIDPAVAAERLNKAFNTCLMAAGESAWTVLDGRSRGQLPYACGMALEFALTAMAQREHPDIDVFEVWRRFWSRGAQYGVQSLTDALEAQGDSRGAAMLRDLLQESTQPLRGGLLAVLSHAGLVVPEGGKLSQVESMQLARNLVSALMQIDCAGQISFHTLEDHFLIDELDTCGVLRGGMKLHAVGAVNLFEDAKGALTSARERCKSGEPITLQLLDTSEVLLKCDAQAASQLPASYSPVRVPTELVTRVLLGDASHSAAE
jgi:hypothetical protein